MVAEPVAFALHSNDVLQERYKLLRRLGEGGAGVVYEAFDERRGLTLALKTLERPSSEKILLLKREFRAASEFRHPNLLRLYDLVARDPHYFFTMEIVENAVDLMEYVRGLGGHDATPTMPETLTPSLEETRKIDLLKTTPYISLQPGRAVFHQGRLLHTLPQVCAALSVLHEAGLVHRDLKPENILVTQSGVVKVLDFGISQSSRAGQEAANSQVSHAGTPRYMSPEQASQDPLGPPSDLYSLGVILYELLTGVPPFEGEMVKVLVAHVQEEPLPPSRHVVGIPPALEQLCLALLAKNPDERPTLAQVMEQLVALGAPEQRLEPPRPRRFVGRAGELARVEALAEHARAGAQGGALVRGESGAGKSTLCAEFARSLMNRGWALIGSRCYERELLPYNALDPLLDAVSGVLKRRPNIKDQLPEDMGILAAMFPILRNIPGVQAEAQRQSASEGRQRAARALRHLLRLFQQERPLALWVDDLQWADADSLHLLGALFVKEELPSFFLLGSIRAAPLGPEHPLSALARRPDVATIDIPAFGEAEVRALLGERSTPEVVRQIAQEAQGNAFFATELLRARLHGENRQEDLASLLIRRLWALAEPERRVVESLAINGAAASFRSLRRATGLGAPALSSALDGLLGARWVKSVELVREGEDAVDLYHSRIRETVEATLSPERSQALHRAFAEILAESNSEPEVIAGHYIRAGETQAATPWLLAAARKAASQLAPERAEQLYLQALDAGGPSWSEAQTAREERARVLDRAGAGYQDAAAAFREAAAHTEGYRAVKLMLGAAEADLKSGKVEAALSAGAQALAPYERLRLPSSLFGSLTESALYIMRAEWRLFWLRALPGRSGREADSAKHYLYHRLSVVLSSFDLLRSMVLASRSLELALSRGSDEDIVDALALYSVFIGVRRGGNNLSRAARIMSQALSWRAAVKDPELNVWLDEASAILCVLNGDYRLAREQLPNCLARYHALGRLTGIEISSNLAYQALAESALGVPRAALDYVRPALEHALSSRDLFFLRSVVPSVAWVHLLLGDVSAARRLTSELPADAALAMNTTSMPLIYYEAALDLAEGNRAGAAARLEHLLSAPLRHGLLFFGEARIRAHFLLSAVHLSEARSAKDAATRKTSLARAWSSLKPALSNRDPVLEGIGFRMAGLIEAARNKKKPAKQWLDRAVKALSTRGEAAELAAALLARGSIFGQSGDLARGKEILTRGALLDPAVREGNGWSWR
jgi:hypothetical protein